MKHPVGPCTQQPKTWPWFLTALLFCALVYLGWRTFWFLTDDAFISFRYVSNSVLGRGYTWNPPPFRPVEGYTNFLWVVVLDLVWRVFHVAPPESANYISLIFTYCTLLVGVLIGLRMRLTGPSCLLRPVLLAIAVFGTITNRTFLAWASSGLETAMFNFFITAWIFLLLYVQDRRLWVFSVAAVTSLIYLTRPDGILFVSGTLLAFAIAWTSRGLAWRDMIYGIPGLAVPVHFIWRRVYYKAWLPNTYFAKSVAPWPEAGVRYALSFIIEYSLWVWLVLVVFWVGRNAGPSLKSKIEKGRLVHLPVNAFIITGVLAAQFGYYTFVIGGDHFEYRVYSHLILLLFISAIWLADKVVPNVRAAVLIMTSFVILSLPIPWAHWTATHNLEAREETLALKQPVAQYFPAPLRGYVRIYDDLQAWLINRAICRRHQEHKVFYQVQVGRYPSRTEGEKISWDGYPVIEIHNVGVPGWVFPNVAIIDHFGLNDYVIARNPVAKNKNRYMAHDRFPPPGYVEGFRPNLSVTWGHGVNTSVHLSKRAGPLTSKDITDWENKWWDWADAISAKQ